jgi:pectinesterase
MTSARALSALLCCALLAAPIVHGSESTGQKSTRPQLTAAEASLYSYKEVLKYKGAAGHETADPWDPLSDALVDGAPAKPDYIVDAAAKADGASVFNSVQAAIARAVADGNAPQGALNRSKNIRRLTILVKPGIYHELVYVPPTTIPITLVGGSADAKDTVISANLDAAIAGADYARKFGAQFAQTLPAIVAMYGAVKDKPMVETVGSAIVWIRGDGFQARNITFENAYNKDRGDAREECPPGGCATTLVNGTMQVVHHQAVALMVDGADRVQFENTRLIGYQDTLFLKAAADGVTARSFFDRSYIEGDVDFIFGDTTAYFYRSEIKSLGDRSTSYMAAPSTNYLTRYGFVFDSCRFTNDGSANALKGNFYLARQWFHSQRCTPYAPVTVPQSVEGYACNLGNGNGYQAPNGTISKQVLETVGKVVILHSKIGVHINREHPWSNWNNKGTLAYRPVQYDSNDYWDNLVAIHIDPVAALGYGARREPVDHFLAEFDNTQE